MVREVLAVVSGNHIHHVVPGECGGSVKSYQVHLNQLWGAIKEHAWAILYEVIGSARGLTVADIRGSAVVSVGKSVRKGEFTEKATIGCGRERLVGARVETHPAISTKQKEASHCFIGNDIYPYRKRRGRCTVVVRMKNLLYPTCRLL